MRVGRRLRHVVVAHQRQHAAMPRTSGEIGMAENIARAVDARSLAVPQREYAIMAAFPAEFRLLRAPAGGGGKLLVEAGLEHDARLAKLLARPP